MKSQTETLWMEMSESLSRYISKRVSDPQAADDILQESFLAIHDKAEEIRDPKKTNLLDL